MHLDNAVWIYVTFGGVTLPNLKHINFNTMEKATVSWARLDGMPLQFSQKVRNLEIRE